MTTLEFTMFRNFALLLIATLTLCLIPQARGEDKPKPQEFPKPSLYPKTWELSFEHGKPTRVVVQAKPTDVPRAYWYMIYTVTNNTDQEQLFMPSFELVTEDGTVT